LAKYVARALEIVDKSGLPYKFTPMGTIVEGEWNEVLELIRRCHQAVGEVAPRVITRIVIDDRRGRTGLIESKVRSVEREVGRELKK